MSDKFNSLSLTEDEKKHLLYFLKEGLRDPDLQRYKPEAVGSGFCFPNNDPQSNIDTGCN